MVNPQLSEYVASQLGVGVPREAVKAALLSSGWAEGDINEALGVVAMASAPVQPVIQVQPAIIAQPVQAVSQIVDTVQPAPERVAQSVQATQPAQPAAQIVQPVAAKSAMIKTSDIFQPKNEPVFQPKASMPVASTKVVSNPAIVSGIAVAGPSGIKKYLVNGVLGFVAFVGFGLAVMFYMQMADLEVDLDAVKSNRDVLAQQINAAQKERDDLQARVTGFAGLEASAKALEAELVIFKTPENATSTVDVSAKGTLHGGDGKTAYSLRTVNDIVLTVKNWKDTKVDVALKPLVGTIVEIAGNHVPGSRDITVLGVNGKTIE